MLIVNRTQTIEMLCGVVFKNKKGSDFSDPFTILKILFASTSIPKITRNYSINYFLSHAFRSSDFLVLWKESSSVSAIVFIFG